MYDKMIDALSRVFAGSGDRIAVTRTLAPALWAGAVAFILDVTGVDITEKIADLDGDGGISIETVQMWGPLILFAALYLVGKYAPGVFERVLLLVKVDDTVYERGGTYRQGTERIPTADVVRADELRALADTLDPRSPHEILDDIEAANTPEAGARYDRGYDPDPLVVNAEVDPSEIVDGDQ